MKKGLFTSLILAAAFCFSSAVGIYAQEAPDYSWPKDESVIPGKGNLRNNNWFQGHFKNRRTDFWKAHEDQKDSVVFLGDSITENWERFRLAKDFPEFKIAPRGISGDVTRTVLYRLQEDVIDLNPRAVVLLIGTNDLDEGNKPEDIAANTIEIMERLKAYKADMPVLFCKIMPRSQTPDFRTSFIIISNKIVTDYINKANNPYWHIVDTYGCYATDKGVVEKATMNDFLHPVPDAYDAWRDMVKPILLKYNLQK